MSGLSSRIFEAQFAGRCANEDRCDGIKEGDRVFYASPDASLPQHVPGECHYTDPLVLKHPVCPRCKLERLASGACSSGCDD